MESKELLKLAIGLVKGRMDDLEKMDQSFRVLNERVTNHGSLLGCMVDLARDSFSGDEETLAKIAEIIESDRRLAKELCRDANRFQAARDQVEAGLATLQARIGQDPPE